MMPDQFDITNHKWSDKDTSLCCIYDDYPSIDLCYHGEDWTPVNINKDDSIAIAKHFGLIKTGENKLAEIQAKASGYISREDMAKAQRMALGYSGLGGQPHIVPQSETTYPNLNLDNVDMQESELFNKGDLHG